MNKLLILIALLCLGGCVNSGDKRPEAYLKGETLLQQGLDFYKNDDFIQAQQKFSAALVWYQSFDNTKGITLAQLNLLETALAVNDFSQAQTLLNTLSPQADNDEYSNKIKLLQVKLAVQQQHYSVALQKLQPLLSQLDLTQPPSDKLLNLLVLQAKLEILTQPQRASAGLQALQTALAGLASPSAYYQALLNQLLAQLAVNRQDYATAGNLLNQALVYYQTQANRRAIASCLEQLATIEQNQQHWQTAKLYLHKALLIRSWLKDSYKSNVLQQQLQWLSRH